MTDSSKHYRASDLMVGEQVHDFVNRWLQVVISTIYMNNTNGRKDWRLLEDMPVHPGEKPSNVISFSVNRKTQPPTTDYRSIYRTISRLVIEHCIDSPLSLPGFYAFLRSMSRLEINKISDEKLNTAADDLITGYWERVKPSTYDVSNANAEEAAAIQGIEQMAEQSSEKDLSLKAQLPFKAANKIKQNLQQVLGSRPGATPTLTR